MGIVNLTNLTKIIVVHICDMFHSLTKYLEKVDIHHFQSFTVNK